MSSESPRAPLIVNKKELAQIFGVSIPTVDTWITAGCPIERGGSNGIAYEFDADKVKAWRLEEDDKAKRAEAERQRAIQGRQAELFADARLAPTDGTIGEIRDGLEAERLAIIVSKQKGELIAREDVRNDYAAVFQVVRQHMLNFSAALTRVAGLTPDQQREAETLARRMLVAMHGQIKDPDLRPAMDNAA